MGTGWCPCHLLGAHQLEGPLLCTVPTKTIKIKAWGPASASLWSHEHKAIHFKQKKKRQEENQSHTTCWVRCALSTRQENGKGGCFPQEVLSDTWIPFCSSSSRQQLGTCNMDTSKHPASQYCLKGWKLEFYCKSNLWKWFILKQKKGLGKRQNLLIQLIQMDCWRKRKSLRGLGLPVSPGKMGLGALGMTEQAHATHGISSFTVRAEGQSMWTAAECCEVQ